MATLGSEGPFLLKDSAIDKVVSVKSPGNYALGHLNSKGIFIVKYVGRSDDDLNDRLHDWTDSGYKYFKAGYASDDTEAYIKECNNYHDFGESKKLDNKNHPDAPDGNDVDCPVCGA